jgi:hypothetical protein
MPLPAHIISVSAFVCEKILKESDGVLSAIRIIDVFMVRDQHPARPEGEFPTVQTFACVLIKASPGKYEHSLRVKMQNSAGEINELGEPFNLTLENKQGMGDIPTGASIQIELNIAVKRYGTYALIIYIDGEEASRVPFTILQQTSPEKANE